MATPCFSVSSPPICRRRCRGFSWPGWIPLVTGALSLGAYFLPAWRRRWPGKLAALLGVLALGAAESMALWYAYSHYYIVDEPLARSFHFGPPLSFLWAFVALWFCRRRPRAKYQGLTLATLGQPILQSAEAAPRDPEA